MIILPNNIQTPKITTALLSAWKSLFKLRVLCAEFKHSDSFLNLLSVDDFDIRDTSIEHLQNTNNPHNSKEFKALHAIWTKPLDLDTLEQCIRIMHDENYTLTIQQKQEFQEQFTHLRMANLDELVSFILFVPMTAHIFPDIPNVHHVLGLFSTLLGRDNRIMPYPILNHRVYSYGIMDFPEVITEDFIVHRLSDFKKMCDLGSAVLKIFTKKLELLEQQIKNIPALDKLIEDKRLFDYTFGQIILQIIPFMNDFQWKRDKVARFLNKLADYGLLIEHKIGKEKLFVNPTIFSAFSEIITNKEIQQIIM